MSIIDQPELEAFPLFADLPDDIARSIFELAADDKNVDWECALVSKKVKQWVEPVLYKSIVIDSTAGMSGLCRTIQFHPSKDPHFFSLHVKRLSLSDTNWLPSCGQTIAILEACQSVKSLELLMNYDIVKEDIQIGVHNAWHGIRPQILTLPMLLFNPTHRHFRLSPNRPSLFVNVTHLELFVNRTLGAGQWSWASLSSLEALTHLCLSSWNIDMETADVARNHLTIAAPFFPPSLVVCAVAIRYIELFWDIRQLVEKSDWTTDDRVVVSVAKDYYDAELKSYGKWVARATIWRWDPCSESYYDEWQGFWDRAERMVKERRESARLIASKRA
ncbi:hypothetical protein DFP72DRAFT_641365 [Ephemerocybe angulata]|uniref:Uncharacterized protein n=1 Tax=Ephemerocybe angulata TaxID=980116 RepID=A0A8H6LZ96_9AGAR|nr:hypothetical protein DFP72DRAFT_641365 [Tulosesus angulatus]